MELEPRGFNERTLRFVAELGMISHASWPRRQQIDAGALPWPDLHFRPVSQQRLDCKVLRRCLLPRWMPWTEPQLKQERGFPTSVRSKVSPRFSDLIMFCMRNLAK